MLVHPAYQFLPNDHQLNLSKHVQCPDKYSVILFCYQL